MARTITALLALLALAWAGSPAAAQEVATPPAPLWQMAANGDAVQTDLGFVLPARIGDLERRRFTSTRPDGASVMSWYESADRAVSLRILIQLRADIRGLPLPGADGVERNWPFLARAGDAEFDSPPVETLIDGPFLWGTPDRPNGRIRITRHATAEGPKLQGLWYRNFGHWAVLIVASGPESRRNDIELAGIAAINLPWPRAPLTAELRAMAPVFAGLLAECADYDRTGAGRPVDPGEAIPLMLGIGLGATMLDSARALPHPVLQPEAYCRIETFEVGDQQVVALGWRGDASGYPAARYAFMIADGSTFFQVESFFSIDSVPPEHRQGISRLVWLTASNARRLAVLRVFTDWPSYEDAKAVAIAADRVPEIVRVSHPARGLVVDVQPSQ